MKLGKLELALVGEPALMGVELRLEVELRLLEVN
jgi:hypothetical protein